MEYITLMIEVENIFKAELHRYILKKEGGNDEIAIQITIDVLYSEIMALGYNSGNVEKTFNDLQNESNQVLGNHVYKSLLQTSKDYKKYVNKFSEFYLQFENGIEYKKLIENLNENFI
jgi:hypothetical protein